MDSGDLRGFGRHGGRMAAAHATWPDAPRPWLDLSTGINPVPWTPPPHPVDPAPLPDPAALAGLEAIAARAFGADPAHVAAVPGSEVALRLLPHIGLPGPIVARTPCYGTHRAVAADTVADPIAWGGHGGTLLLANPNNPDGTMLDDTTLRAIAARQAAAGGWLVVDEAFADAMPGPSLAAAVAQDARIVVLRSFGKFFGLAGVRLGFMVAPAPVLARLRGLMGDWPVSAHAIGWGAAAYADARWIAATRVALAARATALDAVLAAAGLTASGACPLFRLVTDKRASALFARLACAGILTRPFADRPDRLRLGLPTDAAALARLGRALG